MNEKLIPWEKKIELVLASYNRISDRAGFAREFYNYFFKLQPKVKDYFKNTDFDHQEKALLRGLEYLMQFLDGKNENARNQIKRLAQSHSFFGLKIHPHHYYYWVEALVLAIRDFDPYWTKDIDDHWREVLHFPISFMMSQYFKPLD